VVDASPLVMAIWSLSAIWDIPDRLHMEERQAIQEPQDRSTGPGGEAT